MTILIIGTFVTGASIVTLLYQLYVIELNKAEILSLYALLHMNEITKVYRECDQFMEILDEGSLIAQLGGNKAEQQDEFAYLEDVESEKRIENS